MKRHHTDKIIICALALSVALPAACMAASPVPNIQLKIQVKKLLTRSVSMAVLFCFNLLCSVQAQGIEGAPAGTGISDHWYYDGAQLYERWKFAPTISCFIASILTALAAVVYFKHKKRAAVPMFLFFSVPAITTALVTYLVNHLQDWYVAYQLSQYHH